MSQTATHAGSGRYHSFDLPRYLEARTTAINRALDRLLPKATARPGTIHRAMRYSLFAGGKRIRPALCLAAAEACGGKVEAALPLACAIECVHTYSLIHDDLPAMDNDDYRRGKLTNHKVFGEGIAILAGDALLTQAFEIAANHERKTSALLCCSIRLGGMSANCSPAQLQALTDFGYNVGLAFQIIDDILDVTQTSEQLGKTAGKDQRAQKATYPSIVGLDKSRQIAERLTRRAFAALETFKGQAQALEALATFLLQRNR